MHSKNKNYNELCKHMKRHRKSILPLLRYGKRFRCQSKKLRNKRLRFHICKFQSIDKSIPHVTRSSNEHKVLFHTTRSNNIAQMSDLSKPFGDLTSIAENMEEEESETERQKQLELEEEIAQTPETEATTSHAAFTIPKLNKDPSGTTQEHLLKSIEEEEIKDKPEEEKEESRAAKRREERKRKVARDRASGTVTKSSKNQPRISWPAYGERTTLSHYRKVAARLAWKIMQRQRAAKKDADSAKGGPMILITEWACETTMWSQHGDREASRKKEPSERWGHGVWFFKTDQQKANQEKILEEIFADLGGEEGFKTKESLSDTKNDDRPMFVTYIPQVKEQHTYESLTVIHMIHSATYTGSLDHHGTNRRIKKARVPSVVRIQRTRRIHLYRRYGNNKGQDIDRHRRQRRTRARYKSRQRMGNVSEKSGKIRNGVATWNIKMEREGKGRRPLPGLYHNYTRNTFRNVQNVLTNELPDHLGNDHPRQQEASVKSGGESYGARDEEDDLRGSSGHELRLKTRRMYIIRQREGRIRKMSNVPGPDLSLYNSVKCLIIKNRFSNLTRNPSRKPGVCEIREPTSDTQKIIKVTDSRISKDDALKAELLKIILNG